MDRWIGAALDYIPRWLDFQMRVSELPGLSLEAERGLLPFSDGFDGAFAAKLLKTHNRA